MVSHRNGWLRSGGEPLWDYWRADTVVAAIAPESHGRVVPGVADPGTRWGIAWPKREVDDVTPYPYATQAEAQRAAEARAHEDASAEREAGTRDRNASQ